ncbi:MAG: site-2 protease family protein [Candidatus Micrarchaeota archaeon]
MINFNIEKEEAVQIIICVLAISFAFAIVFYGLDGLIKYPKDFLVFSLLCLATIGIGFIFHEMGHKILAMHYGAYAKFQMWVNGLGLMIITSFLGFLFAAPGAVYIYSNNISKRENGLISLVGPLINVAMVFVFLGLRVFLPAVQFFPGLNIDYFFGIRGGTVNVWAFGAGINLMLALFNMMPIFPLDGSKVYDWNRGVWFAVTASFLALGMFFYPGIIISWIFMLILAFVISKVLFRR